MTWEKRRIENEEERREEKRWNERRLKKKRKGENGREVKKMMS